MILERSARNPILTRADLPGLPAPWSDATSVFNPGAILDGSRTHLVLRVQSRGRETCLLHASSTNGIDFEVSDTPLEILGLDAVEEEVFHVYDPRLTRIEGRVFMMFAADTQGGCRLGVAETTDFESFALVSFDEQQDCRNGVLFPERLDGRYLRLDRPNRSNLSSGVATGDTIFLSESADLVRWTPLAPLFSGRLHYWDELIGSGPPPIKTKDGWLHVYHGVATHLNAGIYQAGVCLLDLADPSRVIARGRNNILEPRELYEMVGQVPNVVFPSGMIAPEIDKDGFAEAQGPVYLYYGAADSCVGLATTTVQDLLDACA